MKEKFTFTHVDKMTGREMFCVARLRNETFVAEQKLPCQILMRLI